MPRRLIIALLIVLILGVVGGTVALIVRRLTGGRQVAQVSPAPGELPEADRSGPAFTNPTGDDDGDGLTNADEFRWNTLPTAADSDGDGTSDGQEVSAGRNPTIAGPNDSLPANFDPTRDLKPLPEAPLAVEQFFESELDLTGSSKNYTEEYRRRYPEAERTPDTLVAYAREQPIITQLPVPRTQSIDVQKTDTPLVLAEYLDVAGSLRVFADQPLFAEAINNLFENEDPSTVESLAILVRVHQENLAELKVPPSAANLHKLLLGYSELLAATFDQMARYNDDPVRATVALQQWEEIDTKYIPIIEREVDRLTALQRQLAGN